jgi:hypothetical protein
MKLYNVIVDQCYAQGNRIIAHCIIQNSDNDTIVDKVMFSYYLANRLGRICICCQILLPHPILKGKLAPKDYTLVAEVTLSKNDIEDTLLINTESTSEEQFQKSADKGGRSYSTDVLERAFGSWMTLKTAIIHNIPPVLLSFM